MSSPTVPEAGISRVGVPARSGWVTVARSSPVSRSSVSPSSPSTSTDVSVTGAVKALVTSRSYSRWSAPSLPGARRGAFVAATKIAVVGGGAAGEATGVAWRPTTGVGAAAIARSTPSAAKRVKREPSISHLR